MKKRNLLLFVFLIIFPIVLGGCGDDDDDNGAPAGTGTSTPAAPIQTVTRGTVTAIGSVTAGGVTYNTDSSTFIVEGDSTPSLSDIGTGMVVTINGTINPDNTTGTAQFVEFHDQIEGPVDSKSGNTFVIMGQTVVVDDSTVFSGTSLAVLQVGDVVEVCGMRAANGTLRATRIEKKTFTPGVSELEIRGTVASHNGTSMTFMIEALTVNYSGSLLKDVPTSGLADGMTVEVKSDQLPSGGIINATSVEVEGPEMNAPEGVHVELEGLITSFTSAGDFEIEGQKVNAQNAKFEGGSANDLAVNVMIEAEGVMQGGVLVASEVHFCDTSIQIEAVVEAINASNGTITLMGITVTVSAMTETKDGTPQSEDLSNLNNINVGDELVIHGYKTAAGIVANELERKPAGDIAPDNFVLQGSAENISDPTFVILGVTVNTQGTAENKFKKDDVAIGRTAFFGSLTAGKLVQAKGTYASGTLSATEVELED